MEQYQLYTDLIHLFLDKEATQTETDLLFAELGKNPALQREFQHISSLHGTMAQSVQSYQPPADLSHSVFSAAGIPLSSAAGTAAASGLVSAAGKGMLQFIQKFIVGGVLLSAGAGLMYIVEPYLNHNGEGAGQQISPTHSAQSFPHSHPTFSGMPGMAVIHDTVVVSRKVQRSRQSVQEGFAASSAVAHTNRQHNGNATDETSDGQFSAGGAHQFAHGSTDNHSTTDDIQTPVANTVTRMEYRNAATITPAPRRQQYCPYDAPILLSPGSTTYSRVPDYLFVGSSIGVAHLPTRPIAEAGLADISGELLWKVSGGLMMGFTAGREQIPHFDIQAQGDSMVYTQINAVTFAGMALRYSLPLNKATYLPTFFRDCSLQTSFTGAGSSSGGVLRVGVGLSYPLNPLFDLHLGTTLNALVFRNKGSYQTAERIGIGMGIGFRF